MRKKLANTKHTGHFLMVNCPKSAQTKLVVEFNSRWSDDCGVPLSLNGNNTAVTAMAAMLDVILTQVAADNDLDVSVEMNRRGIIALQATCSDRKTAINQLRTVICQAQLKVYNLVRQASADERRLYSVLAESYLKQRLNTDGYYRDEWCRCKELLLLKLRIGFGPYVIADNVLSSLGDKFLEFTDAVLSVDNCRISCYCDMAVNGTDGIKPLYDSTYQLVREQILGVLADKVSSPKERTCWKIGALIEGDEPVVGNWVGFKKGLMMANSVVPSSTSFSEFDNGLMVANQMDYSLEAEAAASVLEEIVSQRQSRTFSRFETFYTGSAIGVFAVKSVYSPDKSQLTADQLRDDLLHILSNVTDVQLADMSNITRCRMAASNNDEFGKLATHDWEVDRFTRRAAGRSTLLPHKIRQVTIADLRRLVMDLTAITVTAISA